MIKKIETPNAPKAIGPYSQAIMATGQKMVFISGQIPLDAQSMQVESQDIVWQTKKVLENLLAIVEEAGANIQHIVKTTVYLKNMDNFSLVNEIYGQYFCSHHPARVCIEVSRLPRDVQVEIDAILVC